MADTLNAMRSRLSRPTAPCSMNGMRQRPVWQRFVLAGRGDFHQLSTTSKVKAWKKKREKLESEIAGAVVVLFPDLRP